MRRRVQTPAVAGEEADGVPAWVLESASVMAACRELAARQRAGAATHVSGWAHAGPASGGHELLHALRRELRAAGQAWCAERGLSYAVTVRAESSPTAEEIAAGCTGGSRHAAVARLRELVRR